MTKYETQIFQIMQAYEDRMAQKGEPTFHRGDKKHELRLFRDELSKQIACPQPEKTSGKYMFRYRIRMEGLPDFVSPSQYEDRRACIAACIGNIRFAKEYLPGFKEAYRGWSYHGEEVL